MILILAPEGDPHGDAVMREIKLLNADREPLCPKISYVCFDSRRYPFTNRLSCNFSNESVSVRLHADSGVFDGKDVRVVWNRRVPPTKFPKRTAESSRSLIAWESNALLFALERLLGNAYWFPRGGFIRSTPKPYQLLAARSVGLQIPETYIGNDVGELLQFLERFPDVCIKGVERFFSQRPIPSWRKLALRLRGRLAAYTDAEWRWGADYGREIISAYTQRQTVEQVRARARRLGNCPVTYQQYVEKAFEVRCTVVGGKILACAIYSQESQAARTDFRASDFKTLRHEALELPGDISEKVLRLMDLLDLNFACMDFIVTPKGEYIFLEVNTNGQWLWIEEMTGLPIAKTIGELLVSAHDDAGRNHCRGPAIH
jgi:glutathione synthase/RimK-type ligase-like ATP-grasp enzyme